MLIMIIITARCQNTEDHNVNSYDVEVVYLDSRTDVDVLLTRVIKK